MSRNYPRYYTRAHPNGGGFLYDKNETKHIHHIRPYLVAFANQGGSFRVDVALDGAAALAGQGDCRTALGGPVEAHEVVCGPVLCVATIAVGSAETNR